MEELGSNNESNSENGSDPIASKDVEVTQGSSRFQFVTSGVTSNLNKRKKCTSDGGLTDYMISAAQILGFELSKASNDIGATINADTDMRHLVVAAMEEVPEVSDVEKTMYNAKIMGCPELSIMQGFISSYLVAENVLRDMKVLFERQEGKGEAIGFCVTSLIPFSLYSAFSKGVICVPTVLLPETGNAENIFSAFLVLGGEGAEGELRQRGERTRDGRSWPERGGDGLKENERLLTTSGGEGGEGVDGVDGAGSSGAAEEKEERELTSNGAMSNEQRWRRRRVS
ncbi:hypothetical protein Scep_010310 [Stephania cephalantha]|uniref:Uncharacterized protein n=1 Tax=Stephania cephalantha TaxID=152367 RepID=A0AAP0JVK5_9MAGN